jgi:hypothetical protein
MDTEGLTMDREVGRGGDVEDSSIVCGVKRVMNTVSHRQRTSVHAETGKIEVKKGKCQSNGIPSLQCCPSRSQLGARNQKKYLA